MRLSKFILPVSKDNSATASARSHRLMLRAGIIKQHVSGIYSILPLGMKILHNINKLIRKVLDKYDMQEVCLPIVQNAQFWKNSGRYDAYGAETLKMKDRHNKEFFFAPSAEELATSIFKESIVSYKSLPQILYQINWKFRDEMRPRYGLMRAREFLMQDGYSFNIDQISSNKTYNQVINAYCEIFELLELPVIIAKADNGVIGGDNSHEFCVISDLGEDQAVYDKRSFDKGYTNFDRMKLYAALLEKNDPNHKENLLQNRVVEVGHVFDFGTKYTQSANIKIPDNTGKQIFPYMCSFGIGVTRLIAVIIDVLSDERGVILPDIINPFKYSIFHRNIKSQKQKDIVIALYQKLLDKGINILYDDTNNSLGSKFATHDLIGVHKQIIINDDTINDNIIEIKTRTNDKIEKVKLDIFLNNCY